MCWPWRAPTGGARGGRLTAGVEGVVAGHQVAVVRDVVGAQRGQAFNVVAPVAVQLARYAEPGHQLRTGLAHAVVGGVAGHGVEGAGGISHHEHIKLFFQGRQGRESNTHFSHDAGDDQLLLAGGLYCLDEVFVVPGVDLAGASDVRRIREQGFRNRGPAGRWGLARSWW